MNDKEMLELMTTCYERDTKLFKAKIAELDRIIKEQGKTLKLYHTGAIKAQAIRDMVEKLEDYNWHQMMEYADNLEKE